MEEIWRSIEIEGYEVSNFGRVRSVDRTVKGINGVVQNFKGQLIKPFISKEGYACVVLTYCHSYKRFLVHRLVANAFILNPNNLATVNHKDENKLNNHVDNLEWMSFDDNNKYGTKVERGRAKCRICITQETKEGKIIGIFDSISTASKVLNYEFASIQRVVNNKQKFSYGYKFRRSYIGEINKLKESNLKYLLI